jgi:hypothetical protein
MSVSVSGGGSEVARKGWRWEGTGEGEGEVEGEASDESGEGDGRVECRADWVCGRIGEDCWFEFSARGNANCSRIVWSDFWRSWLLGVYPSMSSTTPSKIRGGSEKICAHHYDILPPEQILE